MNPADMTHARISDLRRQANAAHQNMCDASMSLANHLTGVRYPGWDERLDELKRTYQRHRDDWNARLDDMAAARLEADDIVTTKEACS